MMSEHDCLASDSAARLFSVDGVLQPLVSVDFYHVCLQRLQRSINDLLHHLHLATRFLQFGGVEPDLNEI